MRELLPQRLASVVMRDELRQYFRPRHTRGEIWSLAEQRRVFCKRLATLKELMVALS